MGGQLTWTEELVERFWNELTREKPETFFTLQFGEAIVKTAAPHLPRSADVLDFGCGAGFLVPHLLAQGWRVHATDLSPEAVNRVEGRFRSAQGFEGAYLPGDMPSRQFDVIFAVELVEHLYDGPLDEVCSSLSHLLKPGGRVVVTTPNDENLDAAMVYCPVSDLWFHRWQHVRSWTAETLSDRLARHDLKTQATLETNFSWAQASGLDRLTQGLNRALGRLGTPPHLMVIAER